MIIYLMNYSIYFYMYLVLNYDVMNKIISILKLFFKIYFTFDSYVLVKLSFNQSRM